MAAGKAGKPEWKRLPRPAGASIPGQQTPIQVPMGLVNCGVVIDQSRLITARRGTANSVHEAGSKDCQTGSSSARRADTARSLSSCVAN